MSSSRSFLPRVWRGGASVWRGGEGGIRTHGPLARSLGFSGDRPAVSSRKHGGEGGIRTHGPLARSLGFSGDRRRSPPGSMAERVGFEPTDRLHGQRFSRPPHSTTLAPLLVRRPLRALRRLLPQNGGEGGIRTHGRVAPTHAFQACTFDHSVTSPLNRKARSTVDAGRTRATMLSSPPPGRRSIP